MEGLRWIPNRPARPARSGRLAGRCTGLAYRLKWAWSYTAPGGSTWRRGGLVVTWLFLKAEEHLTDAYYRRRGLHTADRDWELHGTDSLLCGYAPIPWRPLRELFRHCDIRPQDVLLECGSGKGRAVIWAAAHYPFRRITGVELDGRLHADAQINLAHWRGQLRCPDVQLRSGDASDLEIPDDVTVIQFVNPFTGEVFRKVMVRIQESLVRKPRSLRVLYYHPRMHNALIDAGFFVERQSTTPPNEWSIYRHPVMG
jgi:hypothetical protein